MKAKEFFDSVWGKVGLSWCETTNCSLDIFNDEDGKYYQIQTNENDVVSIITYDTEVSIRNGNLIIKDLDNDELSIILYEKGPKIIL